MTRTDFDPAKAKAALEAALFGDPFLKAYAVIDGAQCLELLDRFDEMQPPHECLFLGELDPRLEVVAPYLVELDREAGFFDWLFDNGWGRSWCVWATSEASLIELRTHFRKLTLVEMPDGQAVYFRFYDPRVLRAFLPTCDPEQTAQMFGAAVVSYLVESEDGASATAFGR